MSKVVRNQRAAQQFNGREGETATLLSSCVLNFSLRVGGFAPRHLSRWAFRVGKDWRDRFARFSPNRKAVFL